jgi:hypothetical protein
MTDLPQSAYLSLSIRRAVSAAQQRSHRYVTLEHLLLSLLDDPDALALLEAVRADIPAIKVNAADTVNRNLATLYTPGQFDLRASYKVERVLQTASDDADRLNCQEVDAAFVLAAISRESDNPAAGILKRNAFTYSAAMTWLYSHRGKSTARPAARAAPVPSAPPAPEPEPSPEATPAAEVATPEPSRNPPRREEQYSDVDLEMLDEEVAEPAPIQPPAREKPQARPAAAAARSAHLSPAAKPQPAPRLGDERPGASESRWSDTTPIASPSPPPLQPAPRRREASGDGNGYAPASAPQAQPQPRPQPQPQPRQAETHLPSSARLDEMRLRPAPPASRPPLTTPASPSSPAAANQTVKKRSAPAPAPQPAPVPASAQAPGAKASVPPADRQKGRPRPRRQSPQEVLVGRLLENIPRRMRAGVPERIEVRISREESTALSRGMEGRSETIRHDILITQAMSVMLRSPDGGFSIEPLSPETQWIFERPEAGESETYGRWRWVVTPSETGQRRLQLIVAARSIDKNGLVGDTALPDQVITVKVRMNILRSLWSGIQWIAALVLGGVLTELALMGMRLLEK